MGRHSIKMGYELIRTRADYLAIPFPAGVYRFGGTDFPFRPTPATICRLSAGLRCSRRLYDSLANWLPRWWGHSLYFQDDCQRQSQADI